MDVFPAVVLSGCGGARSSGWLERTPDKREVGSSSLPGPTGGERGGCSSDGRAVPLQGTGQGFESPHLHRGGAGGRLFFDSGWAQSGTGWRTRDRGNRASLWRWLLASHCAVPSATRITGLTGGGGGWIMHDPPASGSWGCGRGRCLTGAWRVNAREHQFLRITWTGTEGHLVDALVSDADEGRGTLRKTLVRRVQPQLAGGIRMGKPGTRSGVSLYCKRYRGNRAK